MDNKKRYSNIDLLEAIAILFVIIYHGTLYLYDITVDGSALIYARYFSRTILSTCVPLFFFANGYLLFNREFDLKKHVHKMIRLIIVVSVWAFLLMPLYLLISGEPLRIHTIVMSVLSLEIEWSMNIFWFVGALICLYILFPALKALFDKDKKGFCFFTIVVAILTFGYTLSNHLLIITGAIFHHSIDSLNHPFITMFNPFRGSCGYTYVYFCIGGLTCFYEDRILSISRIKRNVVSCIGILISCTLLFFVAIFFSNYYGEKWDVIWEGYDTIFTFANVIFIYVLTLNFRSDNSFITIISKNTLGLYFVHKLIIKMTRPWIKTVPALCNVSFNIVYGFAVMCVGLVICILLRKIPIIKKML